MTEPCDICGADQFEPYLTVNLSDVWEAEILRCAACGFRQVRPRLTEEELRACYSTSYFDSDQTGGFADYARQQQRHEREAYFLAKQLRRLNPRGRFLEVGCALGFLLDGLRSFCQWDVEGLDVAPFAIHFAREVYGLTVYDGTLRELDLPYQSYDFLLQKDLLEHVRRPRQHLEESGRVLKPGGHLLLVTPNGEANLRPLKAMAERRGQVEGLPLLDQAHLSFFTRDNLLRLFAETGFEVVRFRNLGLKTGLRSLGRLPGKKGKWKMRPAPLKRGQPVPEHQKERDVARLAERIQAEIAGARSGIRSWPPYFYYRHVQERLDSLAGPFSLGNDFEVLLRKNLTASS